MFRLLIIFQIILFDSCVVSRSIDNFAAKRNLVIKEVENISLFDGKFQVQKNSKISSKEIVYLLYEIDTLRFLSNTKRIVNNEFIYRISSKTDSTITLTRATMSSRYYTVDTLVFGSDVAIEKKCLYDENKIVQHFLTEYKFSNDSLVINSFQFASDVTAISLSKYDLNTSFEKVGPHIETKSHANQKKLAFFKKYIN